MQDGDVMRCIQQREKLPQPEACPEEAYALMLDCWKLDVSRRASAAELLEKIGQVYSTYEPPRAWQPLPQSDKSRPSAVAHAVDLTSESAVNRFTALQVPVTSLHIGRLLGEGEFGQVMLGTVLQQGGDIVEVAIKTIKDSGVADVREQFVAEAKLLAALQHPNIVSVVAVHISELGSYLALEYMAGGDLASYLRKVNQASASEVQLTNVLVQISGAMAYLEKGRVVHRDLAARYAISACRWCRC